MAATTSAGFKQQCPTCETMVLIKDMRQVGKKMECPKCKDRFVVEAPAEDEAEETNGKAKGNGKAAAQAKPKKRFREDDDDDEGGADTSSKGKYRDSEEEDEAPAKKKGGSKMLPIILAGVGLLVLIVAAVIIIMNRGDSPSTPGVPNNPTPNAGANIPRPEQKKDETKKDNEQPAPVKTLSAAGAELTNLLPNDTQHVLHVNFKDLLDGANPYRDLIFGAGVFDDADLRRKLGFSPLSLDTLIRAECYSPGKWTYTVLHFMEAVNQQAITDAFGLKEAAPVNNHKYYQATRTNPSFDEFARLSLGVSSQQRSMVSKQERPMTVRFHNAQTVIVGDEAPIVALLKANNQFKLLTDLGPAPAANTNPNPGAQPGLSPMPGVQPGGAPMPGGLTPPMPGGGPMDVPAKPAGRGALDPPAGDGIAVAGVGTDDVFGEPQVAQVAPTILAPPLQQGQGPGPAAGGQLSPMPQPGGGLSPMPGGGPMMLTPGGPPGMTPPGMTPPGGAQQNAFVRNETWLTIDPALKAVMDRLQTRANEAKDKVLFASATDMVAAKIDTSRIPELKNRILWHPRQLWDVLLMLEERKSRIKALGTGLVQRDARVFQYRTEIACSQDADARDLNKDLIKEAAPQIARSIQRLLDHAIDIPKDDTPANTNTTPGFPGAGPGPGPAMIGPNPMGGPSPMGLAPMGLSPTPMAGGNAPMALSPTPMGGVGPQPGPGGLQPFNPGDPNQGNQPKDEVAKSSKLTLTVRGNTIDMKLDLVFDAAGYNRLTTLIGLVAITLKSEVDLASAAYSRHDLATAINALGVRGLSERGVGPGRYPPAALKRTATTRLDQQPYQRMSWLTGLLPHLGHDALYSKIEFDASWQDSRNWLAARTVVPQFLDPRYPDSARRTIAPESGVEMGTTHVVGIAGFGADAADYPRDDPSFAAKRGAFGYDGSAALDEIAKGRGLSNTAVAIQIPHDGPTGVSPWIAGGGATVRGVPEKNSIAPFVLSTDRDGKPIQHKGKRGTYVVMGDGSVRFVSDKVSDQVFQAMATINGPKPPDFDLSKDPETPLVPKEAPKPKIDDRTPANLANPIKSSGAMTPEGKAFHDGVTKTMNDLQRLQIQSSGSLAAVKSDPAKLEAGLNKLVADAKVILKQGRQLKAPPGKEGQDYFAAFTAFLDSQDQGMETEVKLVMDVTRNPTPDAQAKLAKLIQEKIPQQLALMNRLQSAQAAFLNAAQVAAPANNPAKKDGK